MSILAFYIFGPFVLLALLAVVLEGRSEREAQRVKATRRDIASVKRTGQPVRWED